MTIRDVFDEPQTRRPPGEICVERPSERERREHRAAAAQERAARAVLYPRRGRVRVLPASEAP